jgi:hypothetical protein
VPGTGTGHVYVDEHPKKEERRRNHHPKLEEIVDGVIKKSKGD